jgi:autotransporter translocation and assembly factor TamB
LRLRGRAPDVARLPLAALGLRAPIDGGAVELSVDVTGTVHAPEAKVHAEGHQLRSSGVDGIELALDAGYARARASATLSAAIHGGVALRARAQSRLDLHQLLHGRSWHDIPLDGDADIPDFDLSHLPRLGGRLDGHVEVHGTLAHPTAQAVLHVLELRRSDLHLARLDARAAWDGAALTATLDGTAAPKGALHLDARLPADANAALTATLRVQALTLALKDLGPVRQLAGTVKADLHLSGPRAQAKLGGFFTLAEGAFAAGSDPRAYHDVAVDLVAQDGTIELRRLALAVGRGKLSAHGRLAMAGLRPTAIDLTAEANKFPFAASNLGAWLDARAELHGKEVDHTLEGSLTVTQGSLRLPRLERAKDLQPTGPLEDVVFVDAQARRQQAKAAPEEGEGLPLEAQVLAHIPGPFKVESPELHADLRGDLDVRIHAGEPRIYGHVEARGGRIELLGRQYEIDRARANFDGSTDPVIDVRLTRALSNATVAIQVHGTAKKPKLELSSDPPIYDSSQIIGIIVSGDPENQRIDSRSMDQRLVGAVSGVLVSKIKEQIAPGLPIDVLRLETGADSETFGGLGNARLEVGHYIRENLYVSYVHRFGTTVSDLHRANAHEANVEYRFRQKFVVGMRYGDAGIGALDVSWTLRY